MPGAGDGSGQEIVDEERVGTGQRIGEAALIGVTNYRRVFDSGHVRWMVCPAEHCQYGVFRGDHD